jgi:hypothetical protein
MGHTPPLGIREKDQVFSAILSHIPSFVTFFITWCEKIFNHLVCGIKDLFSEVGSGPGGNPSRAEGRRGTGDGCGEDREL